MDSFRYSIFPEQTLCDMRTIINNIGTGLSASHLPIERIVGPLLDTLSHSTFPDSLGFLSSLKTLHLLLQVCVCDLENLNGYNSEQAVKSLKISSGFLKTKIKSFGTTADTLCNIVHLSLVLMSSKDLAENAGELISKCEDSLSMYLASESQQVDYFDPQIALHLLTVILSAFCKRDDKTNNVSDPSNLKISHDLVVQLVLCNNDTLRAQSLITLIPKILKAEKKNTILEKLLDSLVASESEESLNRALAALSALCTYYLPNVESNLTCCVEGKNEFWVLVQRGLHCDSPLTRKHALYLIRRCVTSLFNADKSVSCNMFFWVPKQKEDLFKWWQDICTVFEVLEERAFHLISPVLNTLENIFSSCLKEEDPYPSCFLVWCLTVFRRLLQHSCINVVKWGVDILIGDIGCDLISGKYARMFYPFFLETLLHTLNSPQIFYEMEDASNDNQEIPELKNLENFFLSAARGETRQEFFCKLLDVMGNLNWAPVSLFIFTKSLSKVPSLKCVHPKDTYMMRRLVAKILATQIVSIRLVCLQYMLVTVINLIDCEKLDLTVVLNVLTAFHFDGNLPRGSELWDCTMGWISSTFSENQVVMWMTENARRSDYPAPIFAQLVTLLYDASLLKSFDSLESLVSFLSDCDTRLYVDQAAQTRCVEVIAHMVMASQRHEMCKSQSVDKTREAVLFVVKATACNMMKLLKMRLFFIENRTAYHIALKLLKCFELFSKDRDVAMMFSNEKSWNSFISDAFDIVENNFYEKKINFIFAIKIVNIWCKSAQEFSPNYQVTERSGAVLKKILDSNILVQAPFPQSSQMPPWTHEILASISSAIVEAMWDFVDLNISESAREVAAVQIVEAVGVGLDTGGRSLLPVLLKVLRKVLVKYPKSGSPVLRCCWSNILEVRHKDIFYPALREFLRTVFHPDISQNEWGSHFASECGHELLGLSDSACGLVGELASALQNLVHQQPKIILEESIRKLVVSCFVLSAIQRRDQKLIKKITSSITWQEGSNGVHQLLRDDPLTFVRCTAIEMLIFLISDHEKGAEIADLLAEDLLQQTETAEAKRTRYFSNSLTHRIQLHVLQGLMLIEPKTSLGMKEKFGKWLVQRLLNENHQLSVRYLSEWLLVRVCCSIPHLRNDLLQLVERGDIRESALCSIISTLLHFVHTLQSSSSEQKLHILLSRFYEALLPLTMSQAYSVRFNAHVAILQVWEVMEKLCLAEETKQYEVSALAVQKSFYRASNKFQNHKDFYLTKFRSVEHYSLETLFYDIPRLTFMTRDEWIKPNVLLKIGISGAAPLPLINEDRGLEEFSTTDIRRREGNSAVSPGQSSCIQKKMVPSKWLEINELQVKALPEVLRLLKNDDGSDLPSHGLVVVASLLDKASNLGGLSRTCEIMGASLILPKLCFASDREFQALSMSSEMWAPLSEVKPHELPTFLREMKKRGFALVGAEQTAKSTSLNNVKFTENTVLLLGNECEGIPSNLLPLLDVCVEIPQYGLVRSLNVHVAGALCIYEYRRQHSVANLSLPLSYIDC